MYKMVEHHRQVRSGTIVEARYIFRLHHRLHHHTSSAIKTYTAARFVFERLSAITNGYFQNNILLISEATLVLSLSDLCSQHQAQGLINKRTFLAANSAARPSLQGIAILAETPHNDPAAAVEVQIRPIKTAAAVAELFPSSNTDKQKQN